MDSNKSQENPLVIQNEQDALNVSIDNEHIALNVLVAFIGIAQKRGDGEVSTLTSSEDQR